MRRFITIMLVLFSAATISTATAAETIWEYEIPDFPKGIGEGVDSAFWAPHSPFFTILSIAMSEDTTLTIELESYVDATRFATNHDAKNGGLNVDRTTTVKDWLTSVYNIPSDRFTPPQFTKTKRKSGDDRKVIIRVEKHEETVTPAELTNALDSLKKEIGEPVVIENHYHTTNNSYFSFVEAGIGLSSHRFGTVVPIVRGRTGSDCISFEAAFSHSLFDGNKRMFGESLDVSYRLMGGYLLYSPRSTTLRFIAGWERLEERSNKYGKYTRKFEGPALGIRLQLKKHIACSIYWTPGELHCSDVQEVNWKLDGFRITLDIMNIWR